MKLSFVIPAYNEERYIGGCLDAILREKRSLPAADAADIEIIVVDNASTDGTADVIARCPGVKLVRESQKGILFARRAGFLASSGALIANIDADTQITNGWLRRVLAAFERDQNLVGISGPFIYYDAPIKIRFFTRFFYYIGYGYYILIRFILHVGSILQGGNFVVRRDALEKIGGYDTKLTFYGEDTDVARRLNKLGHVKFTFSLPALSSGRRLAKEGGITIGLRYALNIVWITFFKHPYTKNYIDIRPKENGVLVYAPASKTKEWLLGMLVVIIMVALAGIAAYLSYLILSFIITHAGHIAFAHAAVVQQAIA